MNTTKTKKTNLKLTALVTSVALLAAPTSVLTQNPKHVEAITIENYKSTTIVSPIVDIKEQISVSDTMIELKKEMVDLKKNELERARKQEEWRLEQERIQLEHERDNFFYIVDTHDITSINLTTASGLTRDHANAILEGTGLAGLGHAFVEAEKTYEVNAYYLIAHAAWESSWGTSSLAVNKNNLFGFTAYDASPSSSATKFASKEECINIVANYVKENYLSDNGKYHNGANLQGMNVKYATDTAWAKGIGNVIEGLVSDAKETI